MLNTPFPLVPCKFWHYGTWRSIDIMLTICFTIHNNSTLIIYYTYIGTRIGSMRELAIRDDFHIILWVPPQPSSKLETRHWVCVYDRASGFAAVPTVRIIVMWNKSYWYRVIRNSRVTKSLETTRRRIVCNPYRFRNTTYFNHLVRKYIMNNNVTVNLLCA